MVDSKSYAERHAAAAETFTKFSPGVEPERIADSFTRRQGALGSMAFDVVGAIWARPQLIRRDRSLLVISVLAAQARNDELEAHTRIGLRNGLTRTEIEEILLHVAAYAGYPAAMASSRVIDAALRAAEGVEKLSDRSAAAQKSDAERDRDAADVFRTINGREAADPAANVALMESMLGEVGIVAYRWAFGEIWSRPELSRRDRSIVVIAILTSLGAVEELAVHVPAGLRHGLSRIEIEEVVNHLSLYAGIPRAVEAMRATRAAFKRMDEGA
ncbi:MAG TPA: carboxymuconolactone decarboxylase family protein [Rhizomicrobium sp.]|jgi:4-carboxymuconolactone decarboxylase|nr:carboxymuconolactone decarboxylase family protein [Rhizomicrobium sp.]